MEEFETLAVHAGEEADPETGALRLPLHMSTTFKLPGFGQADIARDSTTDDIIRYRIDYGLIGVHDDDTFEALVEHNLREELIGIGRHSHTVEVTDGISAVPMSLSACFGELAVIQGV